MPELYGYLINYIISLLLVYGAVIGNSDGNYIISCFNV